MKELKVWYIQTFKSIFKNITLLKNIRDNLVMSIYLYYNVRRNLNKGDFIICVNDDYRKVIIKLYIAKNSQISINKGGGCVVCALESGLDISEPFCGVFSDESILDKLGELLF